MPDFHLTRSDVFPNGTEVGAYPVSNWQGGEPNLRLPPPGSAADTQTMVNGSLVFADLDRGRYVAYAEIDGRHVYVDFTAGADENPSRFVTADEKAAMQGTAGEPGGSNRFVTEEGLDVGEMTARGMPVLLGQGALSDGVGVNLDASGGAVALNIEGLEITTPGPIMCSYQNIWELTTAGEVDHHYTVERVGGGGLGNSAIVWVQTAAWQGLLAPFPYRFAIDLPPGTYKIGWRIVLLSGTLSTPSEPPSMSLMSVYTAPPGAVDLDPDPSF